MSAFSHFIRAGSLRVGAYLGFNVGGSTKSNSFPRFASQTRTTTFYGFSGQLGGQIRIKVTRHTLTFKLIDHQTDRLSKCFTVWCDNVVDIKRKSATCVQFKLVPEYLPNMMPRVGIDAGHWLWDRIVVHFPVGTLDTMLTEFQACRFARLERYGLFYFKKRFVPFTGVKGPRVTEISG